MSIDSDWAKLVAAGQDDPDVTRDRQLAALLLHARQMSISLEQVREALEANAKAVEQLHQQLAELKGQMAADAELMAAVRDTSTFAKVATRGIRWFSGVVVAMAGLWWAYVTFRGPNGPPPDIGPGP